MFLHAQVQTLPPVYDVRGARPTQLTSHGKLAEQARDAFARGLAEQPDEWVLHLYLGKACALFPLCPSASKPQAAEPTVLSYAAPSHLLCRHDHLHDGQLVHSFCAAVLVPGFNVHYVRHKCLASLGDFLDPRPCVFDP